MTSSNHANGRFLARPRRQPSGSRGAGEYRLGAAGDRPDVLLVPASYDPATPAPLMLAFHGATGTGERMLNRWRETAERHGVIVLAPSSLHEVRWDFLLDGFGPDVQAVDRALAESFAQLNVDPERVYVEGFSDGASYALSLGLANGDLFTHVLANSPGFYIVPDRVGTPRFLFTHGTDDKVLPIDHCTRMLVPAFERAGYDVTLHEFEGGHSLTPEIMSFSLTWAGAPELPAAPPE